MKPQKTIRENNGMRTRITTACSMLCILAMLISTTSAFAGNGIKQRMKQRLPAIVQLKARGIIGENNQGYLAFVGSKKENPQLIDAENKDRKMVYGAIARKQNTNAALVGSHRAAQIVQKAPPGNWLQDGSGKWYRK